MHYPMDSSRIHMFKVDGRLFLYDVNSCVFTEVDKLAWDVVQESTKAMSRGQIIRSLGSQYTRKQISETIDELEIMESKGFLFSENLAADYQEYKSFLSTLCLNIAQECDLSCRYCFAERGTYGKGSARMPVTVAKKAVDFIIDNSGPLRNLTLCFFGGEPLLNFRVIQETVKYSRRRAATSGKEFRFSITTNGTMLTRPVREFLARNRIGVIFSIDGPEEIQNEMRPFKNGAGSYRIVSKNLRELIEEGTKIQLDFSIRATYTRRHHDISKVALHLVNTGCHDISVEPAVLKHDELEIRHQDLPEIKEEYNRFAHLYVDSIRNGQFFSFFHFRLVMDQTLRATRNLRQCGAGSGYLAVSSDGDVYPCHRFVGKEEYLMGNVFDGINRHDIRDLFNSAYVNSKKKCLRCWARYVCGGGCHAYAVEFNGDIFEPYDIECELLKHRIELGAYVHAELSDRYPDALKQFYRQSSQSRPYLYPQSQYQNR